MEWIARTLVAVLAGVLLMAYTSEATLAEKSKKELNEVQNLVEGYLNAWRSLSPQEKQRLTKICEYFCRHANFCPRACASSTLPTKRNGRSPFGPNLGDLSFEDYMFMELLGRNFR